MTTYPPHVNEPRPSAASPVTNAHSTITTPLAGEAIALLGYGVTHGNVALSRSEVERLNRLYGYVAEQPGTRPPMPPPLEPLPRGSSYADEAAHKDRHKAAVEAHVRWTDPRPFMQAGATRNMLRHADCDGLRMVAWLAKHVEPGSDPLKTLVQLASEAGWDVDPVDYAWANEEPCDAADGEDAAAVAAAEEAA